MLLLISVENKTIIMHIQDIDELSVEAGNCQVEKIKDIMSLGSITSLVRVISCGVLEDEENVIYGFVFDFVEVMYMSRN